MQYIRTYALVWLCFAIHTVSAQKYDYTWLGGDPALSPNFSLNFSQFPPEAKITNNSMGFDGTNLSMSDSSGNLLFFSNGCSIRNAKNQLIQGGEIINIGYLQEQHCHPEGNYVYMSRSMFSLPDSNSLYYVFHIRLEDDLATKTLLFSILDMKQNNGAGKLIVRDSALITGYLQVASANRHANGRDWWILLANNEKGIFYRFLLTPTGLQGPWQQEISNPTAKNAFYYGWSQFSPDGRYYSIHHSVHGVSVYRFDRCTGTLSGLRYLPRHPSEPKPSWNFGMTISPDSRYLYRVIGQSVRIVQYDLEALNLADSEIIVGDTAAPVYRIEYLNTGPDGRIYMFNWGHSFINTINYPDRKGKLCDFKIKSYIFLSYCGAGENFYHPNYRLGPLDGSACDTLGLDNHPAALWRHDQEDTLQPRQVTFTDLSYYEPATWHWTFGDGTMSGDTSPVHTYAKAGVYNVCLVVKNAYAADTLCKTVTVGSTSGTEALVALPEVVVFPNPFEGDITVQVPAQVQGVRLSFVLYDALGRPVRQAVLVAFDNRVSAEGLPPGLYYWAVRLNGQLRQSGKVVRTGMP